MARSRTLARADALRRLDQAANDLFTLATDAATPVMLTNELYRLSSRIRDARAILVDPRAVLP